jgi:hypothetical protein
MITYSLSMINVLGPATVSVVLCYLVTYKIYSSIPQEKYYYIIVIQ